MMGKMPRLGASTTEWRWIVGAVSSTKYNRHRETARLIHNQQIQIVFIPGENFSGNKAQRASSNLSCYPHFIIHFLFISPLSWCSWPLNLFTCIILSSFLCLKSVCLSVSLPLSGTVFCVNSFHFFFPAWEPLAAHLPSCLSFHGFWKWMFYCLH